MATKFKCKCGKVLHADGGTEGNRATCPACHRALLVPTPPARPAPGPEPEGAGPSEGAPESKCPSCGAAVAPEAVICVNCGVNVRTGLMAGTVVEEPEEAEGPAIVLPWRKIITLTVVAAVLVVGWFFVLKPVFDGLRMGNARSQMANGDLHKARDRFQSLKTKVRGRYREEAELRIKQLTIEIERNVGPTMGQGVAINCDTVDMAVEALPSDTGFAYKVTITNKGDAPLMLKEDYFRLRGSSDVSLVMSHADNSVEGLVVRPRESRDGAVVFGMLPIHAVEVRVGLISMPCRFIFFNDGARYVKRLLPS